MLKSKIVSKCVLVRYDKTMVDFDFLHIKILKTFESMDEHEFYSHFKHLNKYCTISNS